MTLKTEASYYGISLTKKFKGKDIARSKHEIESAIYKARISKLKEMLKSCSDLISYHKQMNKNTNYKGSNSSHDSKRRIGKPPPPPPPLNPVIRSLAERHSPKKPSPKVNKRALLMNELKSTIKRMRVAEK